MLAAATMLLRTTVGNAAGTPGAAWELRTDDTRITVGVAGDRPVVTRLGRPSDPREWAAGPMSVPLVARVWADGEERATAWRFPEVPGPDWLTPR